MARRLESKKKIHVTRLRLASSHKPLGIRTKSGVASFLPQLGQKPRSPFFRAVGSFTGGTKMYGLIGKMKTAEGKCDELVKILLDGKGKMPGCLSHVVAKDPGRSERDLDH